MFLFAERVLSMNKMVESSRSGSSHSHNSHFGNHESWLINIMEANQGSIFTDKKLKIPRVPTQMRQESENNSSEVNNNIRAYEPEVVTIGPYHHNKNKESCKPMQDHKQKIAENNSSEDNNTVNNNIRAYEPEVVTIGPYHHHKNKESCKPMQDHKQKIAENFVLKDGKKVEIQGLYKKVEEIAKDARTYYDQDSVKDIDDETFTGMMFLDGCFVAYFIYCVTNGDLKQLNMESKTIVSVARDLFLLENQLPYLVLEVLMDTIFDKNEFTRMVRQFVDMIVLGCKQEECDPSLRELDKILKESTPCHLLDLLRTMFVRESQQGGNKSSSHRRQGRRLGRGSERESTPPEEDKSTVSQQESPPVERQTDKEDDLEWDNLTKCVSYSFVALIFLLLSPFILLLIVVSFALGIVLGIIMFLVSFPYFCLLVWTIRSRKDTTHQFRTASELKATGISFKMSESLSLSSVDFKAGLIFGDLILPVVAIDRSTEVMFLNLIAYETSCFDLDDFKVTSYICFLDSLIDRADDVKELRSDRVLINNLGSDEEAAHLINQLGRNLMDPNTYNEVKIEMKKFCGQKWRTWFAEIKLKYFRSPWTITCSLCCIFGSLPHCCSDLFYSFPWKMRGAHQLQYIGETNIVYDAIMCRCWIW
ncbi:PREDICTED: uncharacterized protein LOC104599532 [Nelumbo nucifera]|uniref:Uncharacterized protein LOC104599532 n=2 Tax=Nelumbo nucifera TaxID=4432 RepID=A0A1U8Q4A0_NELNU|nr:PREDICTED: uncharacterized protein LOC104599532 [Nelumbo nucifera]DAD22719.1 TPA_asm: hypothetical protein HUJ06_024182 [Nelumbo nucifera]